MEFTSSCLGTLGKRDSGTAYWNVQLFQISFNNKEFINYLLYRELKSIFFNEMCQMELSGVL